MNTNDNIVGAFVALIIALSVLSFIVGGVVGSALTKRDVPAVRVDTVRVTDTIHEEKPVYVRKYVRDTIRVAVLDTIRERDTLFVEVPREVKVYENDDYRVVVSGYRPQLDTIDVYRHSEFITQTQYINAPVRRWGLAVQAGGGATIAGGKVQIAPYIGVGVSYNFLFLGKKY